MTWRRIQIIPFWRGMNAHARARIVDQIGGDARQVKVVGRSLSVSHGRRPRGGLRADSGLSAGDELGVAGSALAKWLADEPQWAAIYASSVPAFMGAV